MEKQTSKQFMRINIEIERSKLNREKSMLVLNKGFVIYMMILFVAVIGIANGMITPHYLNIIIIIGIIILVAGIMPYMMTLVREEKKLQEMLDELDKK